MYTCLCLDLCGNASGYVVKYTLIQTPLGLEKMS